MNSEFKMHKNLQLFILTIVPCFRVPLKKESIKLRVDEGKVMLQNSYNQMGTCPGMSHCNKDPPTSMDLNKAVRTPLRGERPGI